LVYWYTSLFILIIGNRSVILLIIKKGISIWNELIRDQIVALVLLIVFTGLWLIPMIVVLIDSCFECNHVLNSFVIKLDCDLLSNKARHLRGIYNRKCSSCRQKYLWISSKDTFSCWRLTLIFSVKVGHVIEVIAE